MKMLELFAKYVPIHRKLYPLSGDFAPFITYYPATENCPEEIMICGGDFFSHVGNIESVTKALEQAIASNQLIENNAG
jgi:hypothetical protein